MPGVKIHFISLRKLHKQRLAYWTACRRAMKYLTAYAKQYVIGSVSCSVQQKWRKTLWTGSPYFPSALNTETKKPRISTIVRIELLKIYIISIFIIFYFWMSLFISLSDMPFDIGMYARQFCNISVRPHSSLKYKTECYNHDNNYLS